MKNSFVLLTSKLSFNGTPLQIKQVLDVRCIQDSQLDNEKNGNLGKSSFISQQKEILNIYLVKKFENKQRSYIGKIIRTEQSIVSDNRRHLVGVVDPTTCTATGTGTLYSINQNV